MNMLKKNYHPLNVLVTGGAGFIGSNFIRYALKQHSDVNIINLDVLTYAGSLENLADLPAPNRYSFIQGDICDQALVKNIFNQYQIDTVVHFAAESHVDRSINSPAQFIQTNVVGTFTLLEAARQFWLEQKKWGLNQCRFHHISTDEVFGSLKYDEAPFTELHRYTPNSPYSASKAGADHLVRAYFHTYQLPVTISNCSNNYGPYQHAEKLIPTIIRHCFAEEAIPIYGDGSNIRDWLYVEDHCVGINSILMYGTPGSTYNMGGCEEMNNLSVTKIICKTMDKLYPRYFPYYSLVKFVTDRPGHDWRYAIDTRKIKKDLGWASQENFYSGIEKTIKFYHHQWANLCQKEGGEALERLEDNEI